MRFQSLPVLALNGGAKRGNFAHNTGEGGISSYHLENGGDLIWQIGTGYFGARDEEGNFNVERYRANAQRPEVKMIELKLSQGAKPGHGGILPLFTGHHLQHQRSEQAAGRCGTGQCFTTLDALAHTAENGLANVLVADLALLIDKVCSSGTPALYIIAKV